MHYWNVLLKLHEYNPEQLRELLILDNRRRVDYQSRTKSDTSLDSDIHQLCGFDSHLCHIGGVLVRPEAVKPHGKRGFDSLHLHQAITLK